MSDQSDTISANIGELRVKAKDPNKDVGNLAIFSFAVA
jgi:hypothetical protein